ncbi:MAG TPA: hypothetical protein DIW23_11410 [Anaerolineae bacterium]|nr:hypothetical protein [Anaerolineae bacterium]
MRALLNIQLPLDENDQFINIKEFRKILQTIGLKPTDMPSDENEKEFRAYCLRRSEPIFDRMPEKSEEDQLKKAFSRKNIIYASDLPQSNTIFMITAHTETEYRFRLLNPKIESLQEGCVDLVLKIRSYNEKYPNRQLGLGDNIDIFEHGLEESTISGKNVKSRWNATRKVAGRDILISVLGLIFFVILTVLNILFIPEETISHTIFDRLSTAMFTAMIVSSLNVYYTYRVSVPIIQWTASYSS